jgi:signal transduction histidine kinase
VAAIRQQAAKHGRIADGDVSRVRPTTADPNNDVHNGVLFSVEAPEPLPPLPAATEVACYRIVQEAMANVARHAEASFCRVSLSIDDRRNELQLEIADDGAGIPNDRRAGVGMSSMHERAEELGGTLRVEPIREGGTRVLARLPLPTKDANQEEQE